MVYSKEIQQILLLGTSQIPLADYSMLGLSAEHAAELIKLATDPKFLRAHENSPKFWGAVHAWYALGQFKIIEAVSPLLDLIAQYPYDRLFDQELLRVFVIMGEATIPEFAKYLADPKKPKQSRDMVFFYLGKLGHVYRKDCLNIIDHFLLNAESNNVETNAFAVCALIDLKAVESIIVIRRAFHKNRVEIGITGDLEDVEIALELRAERNTPKPNYNAGFFDFEEAVESETVRLPPKIGRNDPCPCGSGKKYKKCCQH
jgi:hypothetical protein